MSWKNIAPGHKVWGDPRSPSEANNALLPAGAAGIGRVPLAQPPGRCDIGTGSDLACARGFETREQGYGTSFRWSDAYAEVHLASAGYGRPLVVELTARSGRPAGTKPVAAWFGVNGQPLVAPDVPFFNRRYALLLPARFPVGDLMRLQITSETWKPGPISRTFGLVLLQVRVRPTAGMRWPGPLLVLSWLALIVSFQAVRGKPARWWMGMFFLLLFPLFRISPLLAYLPWLAIAVGAGVLLWRQAGKNQAIPIGWVLPNAALSLFLVTGGAPSWARAPILAGCGAVALVGALAWSQRATRPGSDTTEVSPIGSLLLSAALLRLLLLGWRLLSGKTWLDLDVELFYSYGMALRETGLPDVEYPAGALVVWAVLSRLSGDSREAFALLLPLFNLACDLGIVGALVVLGRTGSPRWPAPSDASSISNPSNPSSPSTSLVLAPAAYYAFSPLLEPFLFGKYDALPAMLAVGSLALFLMRRPGMAGLMPGIGATVKWTPLLAAPFLALHLARHRQWYSLSRFVGWHLLAVALLSLPFALTNLDSFLVPYHAQGGRGMNGESGWALVALLSNPALLGQIGPPWGELPRETLPVSLMVTVQGMVLSLVGLVALVRPPTIGRTLALAALCPALFLILNRVFSPQYLLPISAGLLAALAVAWPGLKAGRWLLALLALAQVSNLLVWPFGWTGVPQGWIVASVILFGCLLGLSGWVIAAAFPARYDLRSERHNPKVL
ncbi:MAG: DUF2029 domain-containing protein [Chloroflexaceae bacterium]|nr:DUF2029 domain-containing protein [Chloroflexaceae bacterium]